MAQRRRDKPARIVDAALAIVVDGGWPAVTLDAVAARTGLDRSEVYRLTPTPAAMLDLFARRIDLEVVDQQDEPPPDDLSADTSRDRLFDVLMRRFEVLAPYRGAVAVLAAELPRDPATVAALLPQAHRSFAQMLRKAAISDAGLRGALRVAALLGLWVAVQRVWLRDDTADGAPTMAALDRHLGRLFHLSPLFGSQRKETGT
jgi:AcrR family transcriptional regulator